MGVQSKGMVIVVTLLSALAASCGSGTAEPSSINETEPLVVRQADAMQALRTWGAEYLHVTWSEGAARITNDGDQILLCGVTSTEVSYQPDHYFGIRPHRSRDLAAPNSPIVRCHLDWGHAAVILGQDEVALGKLFEEPLANGEPAETTHSASVVLMPDPMPNLGVQIDGRYTLLD